MYIKGLAHHKHPMNAEFHYSKSKPRRDLEQKDSSLRALVSPSRKEEGVAARVSKFPFLHRRLAPLPCPWLLVAAPSEWFLSLAEGAPSVLISFSRSQSQ